MTELPKGWVTASVGELFEYERGVTYSKADATKILGENRLPVLRANNFNRDFDLSDLVYLPKEMISEDQILRRGDLLFAMSSGSMSHVGKCITVKKSIQAGFGAFCGILRPIDEHFSGLFGHIFQGRTFRNYIEEQAAGTNINNLKRDALLNFPLAVPPLNEQRRIVEKIEAMFERIDKGVENLRGAKATLALYRQSLLKSAFEGKLTADWRGQNASALETPKTLLARIQKERETRYKSALDDWQTALAEWRAGGEVGRKPGKPGRPPEIIGEAVFPSGKVAQVPTTWRWSPMSDVGRTSGGLTKNQKRESLARKAKYLRVANIYSNELRLDHISEIGVTDEEFSKSRLEKGDLLFVEGNGSLDQIGRVAVWDGSIPDITHQNHLIRFSPDGLLDSQFAMLFMISPVGRDLIKAQASSTSGLHTLSISKIANLPVPICSPAEQAEIIRILDARLTAADRMEAEIDAALSRSGALRQSILKRAFAGTLVPQDPTDEPAPTLLARIKAERAKAGKTKPRKTAHAG